MKKSEWFFILFPLFFVWLLDHYTKIWASSLIQVQSYGYLHFVLSHNHGALLGLFSDLPALLRIVTLSTVGTFLVFSYAAIQYILPIKSLKLRFGMSLLVGGIIGNVTDRILWGYVVDFIILGKANMITPPFNLADIIQWIGYFLICAAVLRDGQLLWPEQNNRKKIWINPTYQYRYITLLIIIGLSLTLIGGVFSYTYLRVTITELIGKNNYVASRFLIPYLGTYITICLIFCCALILMGRIISHRTAGPIYAFQKFLEDLLNGKVRNFKLRNNDDFKQFETLAQQLIPYFVDHHSKSPLTINTLEELPQALPPILPASANIINFPMSKSDSKTESPRNNNCSNSCSNNCSNSMVMHITTSAEAFDHQEEG